MSEGQPVGTTGKLRRGRIILVGRRNAAIDAAKRCGWKPVVIDVHSRREQAPHAFGGTGVFAVEEAIARLPDDAPIAVAAVTTGSVVAAAAIREHFGLPGLSPESALRCHDKLVMKRAVAAAGIPCAPWTETTGGTTAEELIERLGLPVVLKMPISSGGRGVWICGSVPELHRRLRAGLLAEGFVEGTEMSVETYRWAGGTVFRNHTRYLKPSWANVVPAGLGPEDAARVDELAERVHDALGIGSGISHMEIFLSKGGPVFGEIAARPPGGYLMELMARAYDFDPWEALLRLSAGTEPVFPARAVRHTGMWLVHPAAGTVRSITGLEAARAMPGVLDVSCRLRPGDRVEERIGSGQSKGRVLAEAATADACAATITRAMQAIAITVAAD